MMSVTVGIVLLALGATLQLLTVAVVVRFAWQCLREGSFRTASGFPLFGPLLASLGLFLGLPDASPWFLLVPWLIEGTAIAVAFTVAKITQNTRA